MASQGQATHPRSKGFVHCLVLSSICPAILLPLSYYVAEVFSPSSCAVHTSLAGPADVGAKLYCSSCSHCVCIDMQVSLLSVLFESYQAIVLGTCMMAVSTVQQVHHVNNRIMVVLLVMAC
jgi:hypothetical protein